MRFMFLLSWILIGVHSFYLPHLEAQQSRCSDVTSEDDIKKSVLVLQELDTLMNAHALPVPFTNEIKAAIQKSEARVTELYKKNSIKTTSDYQFDEKTIAHWSQDKKIQFSIGLCKIGAAFADKIHELHIDYGVYAQGLMARQQTAFSDAYQRRYYRIMEKYNDNRGKNSDSFFDPLEELNKRIKNRHDEDQEIEDLERQLQINSLKFLNEALRGEHEPKTVNPFDILRSPKVEPRISPLEQNYGLATSDPCYNKWHHVNNNLYACEDSQSGALWYYRLGESRLRAGNNRAREIEAFHQKKQNGQSYQNSHPCDNNWRSTNSGWAVCEDAQQKLVWYYNPRTRMLKRHKMSRRVPNDMYDFKDKEGLHHDHDYETYCLYRCYLGYVAYCEIARNF